ncbi:MAG: ABC transporter permease [Rudanella sp.]|nr:ABC transporter permease [Rudanella sp.]
MLRNYLKIAWRNLVRNKTFSAINLVGLSTGMACCILLLLYIRSELAFDQHHQRANDLYLVNSKGISLSGEQGKEWPMLAAPYAAALQAEFPEIEQVTRLLWADASDSEVLLQVQRSGKPASAFYETKGYQADSTFFKVFSYQFTEGNAQTALTAPNSIVLSEPVARNLFGTAPALNGLVKVGGSTGKGETFRVTGVYRDESGRSHIDARFFVPMSAGITGDMLREQKGNFSSNNIFYTYLRFRPDADFNQFARKLPAFIDKYAGNDLKATGFNKVLFPISVTKLHVYSALQNVVTPTNSPTYLYLLGSIALITLLIACVNFMNLSIAQAIKRAGEIGVRKVLGASVGSIVTLLSKDFLKLVLIAIVIASPIAWWAMHRWLQDFAYKIDIEWWVFALAGLLAVGIALLTVSFQSVKAALMNPVKSLRSE